MSRRLGVVLAALVSAGCVEVQPFVEQAATLEPEKGYVAGWFDTSGTDKFAFGIVNARGQEFVMPFTPRGVGQTKLLGIIALPPGDYRVGAWFNSNVASDRKKVDPENSIARPFAVRAGHVVFLGEFAATVRVYRRGNLITTSWKIEPRPIQADEVHRQVATAYPNFAQAPLECVLCMAPAEGAEAFALPASRGSDFSKKHDVVIHLHRRDGVYDGVVLTAWETFDGTRKRRDVVGASSHDPLQQAGSDDFGAYFVLNDLNFQNGQVNFNARDPSRPTIAIARSFLLEQAHEVWINDGDEKVYLTKEEAVAAQRR